MKRGFKGTTIVRVLKAIATIMPVIGTLYLGLSEVWGFAGGVQIEVTCGLISTACLSIVFAIKPEEKDKS